MKTLETAELGLVEGGDDEFDAGRKAGAAVGQLVRFAGAAIGIGRLLIALL